MLANCGNRLFAPDHKEIKSGVVIPYTSQVTINSVTTEIWQAALPTVFQTRASVAQGRLARSQLANLFVEMELESSAKSVIISKNSAA